MSLRQAKDVLHPNARGQVLVIAVLFLVILLGFAALSIDMGMALSAEADMQAAVDAATLAAASDPASALVLAQSLLTANGMDLTDGTLSVVVGNYNEGGAPEFRAGRLPVNAVQVTLSQAQQMYFASIFGQNDVTVTASAVATVDEVGGTEFGMIAGRQVLGRSTEFCNGNVHANRTVQRTLPASSGCSGAWTASASRNCGRNGVECRDPVAFTDVPGCPGGGTCTVADLLTSVRNQSPSVVVVPATVRDFTLPAGDLGGVAYVFLGNVNITMSGPTNNVSLLGTGDMTFANTVNLGSTTAVDTLVIASGNIHFRQDSEVNGTYVVSDRNIDAQRDFTVFGSRLAARLNIDLRRPSTLDFTDLDNETVLEWGALSAMMTRLVQ